MNNPTLICIDSTCCVRHNLDPPQICCLRFCTTHQYVEREINDAIKIIICSVVVNCHCDRISMPR